MRRTQTRPSQVRRLLHVKELSSIRSYSTTNIQNTYRGCGRNRSTGSLIPDYLCERDLPAWLLQNMKNPGSNDISSLYPDKATWLLPGCSVRLSRRETLLNVSGDTAVSYTHLTLPTNREV